MRLVCSECKKVYDYDVDDFCPRCGAYNPPPKAGGATAVIRKDGVNEANHEGSFVHQEVHREKAQRRRVRQAARPLGGENRRRQSRTSGGYTAVIVVVLVILWVLLQGFLQFF